MLLDPHPWDDDAHRAVIHQAFNRWAVAYDAGAGHQAGRYLRWLRHLCKSAKARYRALHGLTEEEMERDAYS